MWGRVIQTDLVTWPFKVGGHNLHKMRKKNKGIVMRSFPPSTKNLRRADNAPPPAGVRAKSLATKLQDRLRVALVILAIATQNQANQVYPELEDLKYALACF